MNSKSTSLVFLSLAFALSTPAFAQTANTASTTDTESARTLGPITVTAQRREQSSLDVPLSVSAFDGEALEALAVTDITEVAKVAPNITMEVARGSNSTLSAFIRGVGQQDPIPGFEAGVGIYIDDVYMNRPQGGVLDVFDVERIEVLRGPQGTLYGRNTIGGAVKYVTKRLSDTPTFDARISFGNYGQLEGTVNGSVPLSDTVRVGGAIGKFTRDGYGENLNLGIDNYDKDVLAARLSAEFDLSPDFQIRLAGDWMEDNSNPKQGHRLIPGQIDGAPVLNDVFDTRAGLNIVDQKVEASGVSAVAEWQLSDTITLKNILAYREDESSSPIDFDSLPDQDVDVPVFYENDQFSEELQLLYSGDSLNGLVGFYYLDANAASTFDVLLGDTGTLLSLPGLNAQTLGDVNTETWSLFADFTFDLNEQWSVSLGGRYTEDTRTSRILRTTFLGGFSDVFGGAGFPIATTSDFEGEATFDDFSPRVSVSYKPDGDNNIYATYSQGFKGGSFDPRGQSSATPDFDNDGIVTYEEQYKFLMFNPEEVDSFELGWKTSQNGGRFTSNAALFYTDYTDVQVPGSVGFDTDDDGVNDSFAGITSNAGSATIWGLEWEMFANLGNDVFNSGDFFDTGLALGYVDAQYDEFINALGQDISDTAQFQNTPEWTASLRGTYSTPMALGNHAGDLTLNALASYRGATSQFEVESPLLDQDAYTLLDASIRWDADNGHWWASLNGKNLTDEEYIVSGYDFVTENADGTFTPTLGVEGTLTAFYGPPQTVTLSIGYKY